MATVQYAAVEPSWSAEQGELASKKTVELEEEEVASQSR